MHYYKTKRLQKHLFLQPQRVDKVDTLRRRTKMDAGEEARSRQYKGTAMSDDEASKVCKIAAFGIYDKSYRNEKSSLVMM